MLDLDRAAAFDPADAETFLSALPPRAAVVRIEPRPHLPEARPLLLRTADLRRRLRLLLGPPDPSAKRVNLRDYAAGVRYRLAGSKLELSFLHWQHARLMWPGNYRDRLRLYPAALIKLNTGSPYPRAYVTRRPGAKGLSVGPFASRRAAEASLEEFQDLFRIRRCQIKILRDPAFPGCIYSEMKMCLAPCFAGCSDEEYASESFRAASFLRSRGASLVDELARERETASEQLDFEKASNLHKRLEKVDAVRRGLPELARPLDKLDALILQRAAEPDSVAVFIIRRGFIAEPFLLRFSELASEPRSVEGILRDALEPATPIVPVQPGSAREREDHLALLARWFYAQPREGEIFFESERPAGWPYRRVLRACARLLTPPSPPAGASGI